MIKLTIIGAGSAVLEWGCTQKVDLSKLLCFSGSDSFLVAGGNQEQARREIGLDSESIEIELSRKSN